MVMISEDFLLSDVQDPLLHGLKLAYLASE